MQLHISTNRKACLFNTMKKHYCSECKFFKFEDSEGLGWCEQLEEADVNCEDEACVEFEEDNLNELDYD